MTLLEIKTAIFESLCEEYHPEEAADQMDDAEIKISGTTVTIIYDNGSHDTFEIKTKEYLEFIPGI